MAFGLAAALVVAGGICALVVGGMTGEVIAWGLVTLGLGAAVILVFFEIGLSEDHERAEEEERLRREAAKRAGPEHRLPTSWRTPSSSFRRRR
jgi:hypothetical protein